MTPESPAAELLFTGGTVLTGDAAGPRHSAVAVTGGRISALGEAAVAARAPHTEVIDLSGGALLPGFADGHAHPLWGGVELDEAPVRECTSVAEIASAVATYAAAHPEREWVTGGSYEPSLAPGGRFEAAWLDAVVADRPVVLTATDHHTAWCNTEALRRAGITAATADPPAAEIVRAADGSPSGTLREEGAMALVTALVPRPGGERKRTGLRTAAAGFAAAGITWVQDAALAAEDVAVYLDLAGDGRLDLRANLALHARPGEWRELLPAWEQARAGAAGQDAVTVATVKFFADGVIESGTAALLEPYTDAPVSTGRPVWEAGELAAAVAAVDRAGFQAHLHVIGDAAVRTALDALDAARRTNGERDQRPVLTHLQLLADADLARMAGLGVVANFQPLWACLDPVQTELTIPRLGPVRSGRQYPMRSVLDAGVRLSFGSDWPVSSCRPLDGLAVAVSRQTPDGRPAGGWIPQQRLGLTDALAAYSAGVAYQAFEEDRWGRIALGMRADLVQLAADPTAVAAGELAGIGVLGTWLAGRRTYG